MIEWSKWRLGDIATVFDGPHATPSKTTAGPWYLSISSLDDGRVDLSLSAHIDEEQFPRWTRRVAPKPGDTLFSYETRIGQAGYWDRNERAALGRRMGLLRPNPELVDPRFLSLAYLSEEFQELIRRETVRGATVDRILIGEMPSWPISLPPLDEQRRIAGVLGALDDLIEIDRTQIRALEDLARAMCACSASAIQLSEIAATITSRQVRPAGQVEHYSLPAFDAGAAPERVDGETIQSAKLPIVGPVVLISRLNPKWERCWMAYPGDNAVTSTEFVPLVGVGAAAEEIWAVTSTTAFWEQMRSRVTGTTGSHQRVDKKAVPTLLVPDPRELTGETRQLIVDSVREAHSLRCEIADLTRARDELLPLLMSGKIRVSESLEVA